MEKTIKNKYDLTDELLDEEKINKLEIELTITYNEEEFTNINCDLFINDHPMSKEEFLVTAEYPTYPLKAITQKTIDEVNKIMIQNPELNKSILQKTFESCPTLEETIKMLDMNDDVEFNVDKEKWTNYLGYYGEHKSNNIKLKVIYSKNKIFELEKASYYHQPEKHGAVLEVTPAIYWFTNVKSICGQNLFGEGFVRLLVFNGRVANISASVRFKDIGNPNDIEPEGNELNEEYEWQWDEYYGDTYEKIHHAQWILPRKGGLSINIQNYLTKDNILTAVQSFYGAWVQRAKFDIEAAQRGLQRAQEFYIKTKELFGNDYENFATIGENNNQPKHSRVDHDQFCNYYDDEDEYDVDFDDDEYEDEE